MPRSRVLVVAALLAALVPALAGCVGLPVDGPVVTASGQERTTEPGLIYIDPRPARPGDTQDEVVKGFLDAMLATPVQTTTARTFLTAESRDSWDPQRETVVFTDAGLPRGDGSVSVDLTGASRIDARGAWQGELGARTLTFTVVREDDEWRIADPPDALVVPEQWYEQRFRQVSLYFFDPTASILVPEPVFVPVGEQLASTLVRGLLAGPPTTSGSSLTFFPSGLTAGLSVPVSREGVADIALDGSDVGLDAERVEMLMAQLTTTLRQDPAVTSVRVSVDGRPLEVPGSRGPVRVGSAEAVAPYVAKASSLLYGLRGGLLVAGSASDIEATTGPFGTTDHGVRSVVPDLAGEQAAAVSGDGTAVLLGPVRGEGQVDQVLSGASDLLPPAWDFEGRMWLVDRTPAGAVVLQRRGEVARPVQVPGVTGEDVTAVLVSRDGSRLVAVLAGAGEDGDQVVVSRVLHDAAGRVTGATVAQRVDDPAEGPLDVVDVAWRNATGLAVLLRLNDELYQARAVTVDGAPGGLDTLSTTIKGDLRELVGSPAPGQPLLAAGPAVLVPLTGRGEAQVPLETQLDAVTYSGG